VHELEVLVEALPSILERPFFRVGASRMLVTSPTRSVTAAAAPSATSDS
jgi:hypothetical protein